MGESIVTDLGIVCLVFWSIISFLLALCVLRIRKLNLGHDTSHNLEEEEHGTEPLLLENSLENKAIYDVQEGTVLNNPEHPTHS